VNGQMQLQVIRGGLMNQADRADAMAREHPEVDWLGRIGGASGAHSAYVHMPHGGYQAGARTLEGLLDKLDEFFAGLDEPDSG
jgi:hypothetical protein